MERTYAGTYLFSGSSVAAVAEGLATAIQSLAGFSLDLRENIDASSERILGRFVTKGCKWLDVFVMHVESCADGAVVYGYSESTNLCCSWCPGFMRACCACVPFDDHGMNQRHLEEPIDATGLAFTKLFGKRGADMDEARLVDPRAHK